MRSQRALHGTIYGDLSIIVTFRRSHSEYSLDHGVEGGRRASPRTLTETYARTQSSR